MVCKHSNLYVFTQLYAFIYIYCVCALAQNVLQLPFFFFFSFSTGPWTDWQKLFPTICQIAALSVCGQDRS